MNIGEKNPLDELRVYEISTNKTVHELVNGLAYYNYQGNHFRLFKSFNDAMLWLETHSEKLIFREFESEDELDEYLESIHNSVDL